MCPRPFSVRRPPSRRRPQRHDRSSPGAVEEQLAEDQVVASVVSFALLKHEVQSLDPGRRAPWQRLFNGTLARSRACDSIVPVNLDIALGAAELRSLSLVTDIAGRRESLGDLGILVATTALEEHLTVLMLVAMVANVCAAYRRSSSHSSR